MSTVCGRLVQRGLWRERRKYQLTKTMRAMPTALTTILMSISSPQGRTLNRRRRRELETTDTELKAMAAEAMIGLRSIPKNG